MLGDIEQDNHSRVTELVTQHKMEKQKSYYGCKREMNYFQVQTHLLQEVLLASTAWYLMYEMKHSATG